MVERRPALTFLAHLTLILGVLIVAFPVYLTVVASTQSAEQIAQSRPLSLLPGDHMLETWKLALFGGETSAGSKIPPALPMLKISLISALVISLGKIAISLLSACPNIQLLLNAVHFSPSGRRFGSYYGYGG